MFFGEYNHNLDDKKRLIIPKKFREYLGKEFFLTCGKDGCLEAYPSEEFLKYIKNLQEGSYNKSDKRSVIRYISSKTEKCAVDKNGRFQVPSILQDKANIKKEVVFVGVINKLEIWNKAMWENIDIENEKNFNSRIENFDE